MIPKRYASCTLDTYPDAATALEIQSWLDGAEWKHGGNLLIIGPVGTGKTGLAVAALQWFTEFAPRAEITFASVPDLLESLRPPADVAAMKPYRTAHVLVLDDLGVERMTDWARERVYVLVNARYENLLPTIVTTNHSLDALTKHCGERIVSRLQHGATLVAVTGQDLRR